MSKNTGTSELINYFDLGVNGDVGIAGSLDINTIANATTDTDTFLVSDTGIIKYRTGAQLLSDIGAQGLLTNPVTGTGASGTIPVFTGSTTIGNSIIQSNATQVNVVGNGSQLLFDSLGSAKDGGIQYVNDFTLQMYNSRGVGSSIYLGNNNLDLNINPSSNPRLRITSGGNVLINSTTDNGARLQVSGTATISSFITAQSTGGSGLRIYGGSGTNQWDMYLNGANIRFSDNTGTGSFVVDRPATFSSSVTSGTHNINNLGVINLNSQNGFQLGADSFSGGFYIYDNTTGIYRFKIANSGAATFSNSITTSGNINVNSDGIFINRSTSGEPYVFFQKNGVNRGSIYGVTGGGLRMFDESDNQVLTITGTNVLIGTTTNNGAKLQVSGGATFSSSVAVNSNVNIVNYTTESSLFVGGAATNGVSNGIILLQSGRIPQSGSDTTGTNGLLFQHTISNATNVNGGYIYNGRETVFGSASVVNTFISFATTLANTNYERIRITSDGILKMSNNSTTFSIGAIGGVQRIQHGTNGFTTEFQFFGAYDGYAPIGASAFNTRSDYRLKEDLKEFSGLSLVTDMKVYDFKWKEQDERNYGFMAHELQEILPYVVTGTKDGMFEGELQMQGVDYSKLVPVLVKAIQELKQEIDTLKS